ncbi:unnamed protein product [Cunninghamella blakesleeana]
MFILKKESFKIHFSFFFLFSFNSFIEIIYFYLMENNQNNTSTCPTPKGFTYHGLFGRSGFTFSEAINSPTDNWNVILWIASSFFIIITMMICFHLIFKHIRHYNQPTIQQHKLRILLYPPFYALLTWISYLQLNYAVIFLFIATFFEAFSVFNLYTCLFDYLQPLRDQMKGTKISSHVKVLGCFNLRLNSKWGMHFRIIIGILVLQYPIWTILNAIITLILQIQGYNCESSPKNHGAHFYLTIIELISLITVILSLLTYMRVFADEFKQENVPFRGMFWTIKLPIFIVFFVSTVVLSILESAKMIRPIYSDDGSLLWSANQIKFGIKTFICCFAMFLGSIMMNLYFNLDPINTTIISSSSTTTLIEISGPDNNNNNNEEEMMHLKTKKLSPGKAIMDAYFFYIPQFFYHIYQSAIDVCHLIRKRNELRRRKINAPGVGYT